MTRHKSRSFLTNSIVHDKNEKNAKTAILFHHFFLVFVKCFDYQYIFEASLHQKTYF